MNNPFKYIKNVRLKLKDDCWRAKCRYIDYYEKLPINEKWILLESQHGKEFSGNIYHILTYIAHSPQYKDYKIFLTAFGGDRAKKYRKKLEELGIDNVTVVILSYDEYFRVLASAKYLFNDNTFLPFFIKKPGQVYINTWHGTPLKTLGKSNTSDIAILGNAQKNFVDSDYLLYPNEYTRQIMIRDYMLENLSSGKTFLCGYPRNTVFFDASKKEEVSAEFNPLGQKIYVYMPTYRGTVGQTDSQKNDSYFLFYLYELDKELTDDEVFYVNLHPIAKKNLSFKEFNHIKPFPINCETYDFLTIADVLVTDYSSVFFDYACSRKKIVLFPYDKEDYLKNRGMYLDMDDLPFPQVFDVSSLLKELRSEKNYDDSQFIATYCSNDNINVTQQLCDMAVLGQDTGLELNDILDNGKENVLIYAGNLDKNGITTSLRSLTNRIDLDKRNYYISFCQGKAKKHSSQLATFNEKVNFFSVAEYFNLTVSDKVVNKLFKERMISAGLYMKMVGKRIKQNFSRAYGNAKFDRVIQFCGYEDDIILMYSQFQGKKAIWVHNDMIAEIKTRSNQRRDLLKYAYQEYDSVIAVTEDIVKPTQKITGENKKINIVKNTIDYEMIRARGDMPVALDPNTKCSVDTQRFFEIINSDAKKFINVGRYSPEKGHERLIDAFYKLWQKDNSICLIIMGGNSRDRIYEKLAEKVNAMGLENNVILLLAVSNPYPIIKACDYFVLSSLYEGFGLVLAEADILGLPIVSTDINGPRNFMNKYGGTLVENSEDGVYNGLRMLLNNEIKPLNIDYKAYNAECVREFEDALFGE